MQLDDGRLGGHAYWLGVGVGLGLGSWAMVAWVGTPTAETKSLAPLSMTTWLGVGVGSAQGHGRACHRGSSARVGHFATTGVMLE